MKKALITLSLITAIVGMSWHNRAEAAFYGLPLVLKQQIQRLQLDRPSMAPMAHTRFCLQYPDDCKVRRMVFRGGPLKLTAEKRTELASINTMVNRAIRPEPNLGGVATERWLISPGAGDCNDYAVTKRHELIQRGWPARALLLAEVVVASGEHHLVLVVRTQTGDLVADNLNANIRPWVAPRYGWVRVQSPNNPLFWMTVGRPTA